MFIECDAETVSRFSADGPLDGILVGRRRGRRNGGRHAGRDAGLSGGRGRGRCRRLAEDAQSEGNRAEAGKKCCFHKYPFALRCGEGRIWIQKKRISRSNPSVVATAL